MNVIAHTTIQKEDFDHLPAPARRYLDFAGVAGRPVPEKVEIVCSGEISQDHGKSFLPFRSTQVNSLDPIQRIYNIRGRKGLLWIKGRDSYEMGKGRMVIRLLGLIKVADASGPEMDQSALVTFLDDMVFVPQWWLDPRLEWTAIDEETCRVGLKDHANSASMVLHIDREGKPTRLVTDSRYQALKDGYRLVKWSTPLRDFRKVDGVRVPFAGEAIWHEEEGDFEYVRLKVDSVRFLSK